jgi:hypothetical protein
MPETPQPAPAPQKETSDFPFAVTVGTVYDGPLDLLLDLIRRQDIDIYDIPIARITSQYLTYVEQIKHLDVNVAAEFITRPPCHHIKSRMSLRAALRDAPRRPRAPSWWTACSSRSSRTPQMLRRSNDRGRHLVQPRAAESRTPNGRIAADGTGAHLPAGARPRPPRTCSSG